jgi:hypothetical protein
MSAIMLTIKIKIRRKKKKKTKLTSTSPVPVPKSGMNLTAPVQYHNTIANNPTTFNRFFNK